MANVSNKCNTFKKMMRMVCYKHAILRKRHWCFTLLQVILPLFFFVAYGIGITKYQHIQKKFVNITTHSKQLSIGAIYEKLPYFETKIYYAPKTSFTKRLIRKVGNSLGIISDYTKHFNNESAFIDYFNRTKHDEIILGVIFKGNLTNVPNVLDYDIRIYNKGVKWHLDEFYKYGYIYSPGKGSESYMEHGFLPLQLAVGLAYAHLSNVTLPKFVFQEFAYPPHWENTLLIDVHSHLLPLVTSIAFVLMFPGYLYAIMDEINSKLPHLMKIMGGITNKWFQIGWWLDAFVFNLLNVTIITILLVCKIFEKYSIISYCDGFLLFTFLMLYACSLKSLNYFFISGIFIKSVIVELAIFYWVLAFAIPTIILHFFTPDIAFYYFLMFLFPNAALGLGFKAIFGFEAKGETLTWNNMGNPPNGSDEDIIFSRVLLILLADTICLIIFPLFWRTIFDYAKHYYHYLLFCKRKKHKMVEIYELMNQRKISGNHQAVAIRMKQVCLKIGTQKVLNNLNLTLYKNQLTVLLGNNGAGKSSLFSVLTGNRLFTGGEINIEGYPLSLIHPGEIKTKIGICYQDNLLCSHYTVLEHFYLFAMINDNNEKIESRIKDILEQLQLEELKHFYPHWLSGGMKRKVCLGLAMAVKPEILLLDEPTAGMDLETRRLVFQVLNKLKKETTIFIVTHLMGELGPEVDYVAFMETGRIIYFSSLDYLSTAYRLGNQVTLKVASKKDLDDFRFSLENVHVSYYDQIKLEITVLYPLEDDKYVLQILVNNNLEILDFKRKGLNEVFSQIVNRRPYSSTEVEEKPTMSILNISAVSLTEQISILIQKRFNFLAVHVLPNFAQYIMAFVFIFLTIYFSKTVDRVTNNTDLKLTLNMYDTGIAVYQGPDDVEKEYKKIIVSGERSVKECKNITHTITYGNFRHLEYYSKNLIIGMAYNNTANIAKIMYSPNALHGAPISLNAALNTFLGGRTIITTSKPLDSVVDYVPSIIHLQIYNSVIWFFVLPLVAYGYLFTCILYPHFECKTKLKKLQLMAGINSTLYWLFAFTFDMILFTISNVMITFLIFIYSHYIDDTFYGGIESMLSLALVFQCLGMTGTLMAYFFSYYTSPSAASMRFLWINLFTGLAWTSLHMTAEIVNNSSLTIITYLSYDSIPFFPSAAVTYFIVYFVKKNVWNYNWDQLSHDHKIAICSRYTNPCCNFTNEADCIQYKSYSAKLGSFVLIMSIYTILFFILLIIRDSFVIKKFNGWIKKIIYKVRYRLNYYLLNAIIMINYFQIFGDKSPNEDHFVAKHLWMLYANKVVVKDVSFEIKKGECLGLLGMNGAGKTSIFKMLCGSISPLSGIAFINIADGEVVCKLNTTSYYRQIGYCPQINYNAGSLTATTILTTFGKLRGLDKLQLKEEIRNILQALDLSEDKDKKISSYSGGMKRKLSLGIALIGNPPVLLLDEPTAGIDLESRESIMNLLSNYKSKGGMILLTSHEFKGCREICDRVMIIDNGHIIVKPQTIESIQSYFLSYFKLTFVFKKNREYYYVDDTIENELVNYLSVVTRAEVKDHFIAIEIKTSEVLVACLSKLDEFINIYCDHIVDYRLEIFNLEELFHLLSR